jgi:hypothetical protein
LIIIIAGVFIITGSINNLRPYRVSVKIALDFS